MDRLLQLEVFAKTAELGSLSKAAEALLDVLLTHTHPQEVTCVT